jgi:hypothetical protein
MSPTEILRQLADRARQIPIRDEKERNEVLHRAQMLFRKIARNDPHYVTSLDAVEFYPNFSPVADEYRRKIWSDGCHAVASLLITLADQLDTFGDAPIAQPPLQRIEELCQRFHTVARQLRSRHANRPTLEVTDEYDVQDLLHALLKIDFDDVREEEYSPSYAGKASRLDFLLKKEQLVVEVKKSRAGLGAAEVGSQLIDDIARYQAHPDCRMLVCFVYDPEGLIGNPRGIERDLSRDEGAGPFSVRVFIRP